MPTILSLEGAIDCDAQDHLHCSGGNGLTSARRDASGAIYLDLPRLTRLYSQRINPDGYLIGWRGLWALSSARLMGGGMPLPLDLRLLWYFKRTAEIGSLTKAAAELGTSQPALTRHIMRLERELRTALLLRDQRGVTPTEAGALVLDKAENLLRLEQAMKDDIGALSRTIAGDVALCMPSAMHSLLTAPMTSVVAAKFPDIRLRLMDGFDHQSRAQLKSRSADIGVIVYDPDSVLNAVDCRPVAT